jgi:hypothetical protein
LDDVPGMLAYPLIADMMGAIENDRDVPTGHREGPKRAAAALIWLGGFREKK